MVQPAMEAVPTAEFVAAMGLHVASVCVITTAWNGERFGLTATAVSSVCASPPRLLVCVNTSGYTHERIVAAGVLCVNVVSESQDKVAKAFAGMLGRDYDRFSAGEWSTLQTGSPVLQHATAAFDCRITETVSQFTHSIFLCEVVATQAQVTQEPLLYGARRFRTLRKVMSPQSPDEITMESLHF
jgi:flavin reductase (DIM6/NTAB) family NADH-FMN oxidoreductase RutF